MKHQSAFVLSLAVVVLCFICVRTPWIGKISEKVLLEVTGQLSLLSQQFSSRITTTLSAYTTSAQRARIKELEGENFRLKSRLVHTESVRLEKEQLEKVAHFVSTRRFGRFLTAQVLTSPTRGWNKMFIIGVGKAQGITRGQPVLCFDCIVGRIDSVTENFARVMPITHQDFRIPIMGLKTRVQAILAGNGSETPSLVYQQDDTPVTSEEIFVSSAQGGVFPQGYLVGRLHSTHESRPQIQSLVSWGQMEHVQILLDFPLIDQEELEEVPATEAPVGVR